MIMKIFFLIIAIAVVAAACQPQDTEENIIPEEDVIFEVECISDADYAAAGCSGQLCVTADEAPGILTTCEYREEYSCLQLTGCGCIQGSCAWAENDEYLVCLDEIGALALCRHW